MSERCPRCRHFHTGTCRAPQVCFQCGQAGHVKRFCPMVSGTGLEGQSIAQPRTLVQGFGGTTVRPSVFSQLEVGSSGTQGNQRPQKTQTRIFAMTSGEAQANMNTVTSTRIVFGIPARILFDIGSS